MENPSSPTTLEVAQTQIIEHLKKIVGGFPKPDDSLAILGVDSVAMAELTFELEKRFSIQIGDDILDVDTISDLTQYVVSRQQK